MILFVAKLRVNRRVIKLPVCSKYPNNDEVTLFSLSYAANFHFTQHDVYDSVCSRFFFFLDFSSGNVHPAAFQLKTEVIVINIEYAKRNILFIVLKSSYMNTVAANHRLKVCAPNIINLTLRNIVRRIVDYFKISSQNPTLALFGN